MCSGKLGADRHERSGQALPPPPPPPLLKDVSKDALTVLSNERSNDWSTDRFMDWFMPFTLLTLVLNDTLLTLPTLVFSTLSKDSSTLSKEALRECPPPPPPLSGTDG